MRERPRTAALYSEACSRMPGGVSSPVRAFSGLQTIPLMVAQGFGDTLTDVDGYEYIDYCGSFGAAILGHAPKDVSAVIAAQAALGSTFGVATPYEGVLAQKIISHFPSIEKLRFVSSGTEAVMSAIRLARGYTQRKLVVKFDGHYHGHADSLLVEAGSSVCFLPQASSAGILEESIRWTVSLPFNDTETVRAFLAGNQDVAVVLVEPIAGNMGVVPGDREFLEMLRIETEKSGALLLFDEVITGFRVGPGGAQALYGITPDLTCLGKIIGGGLPAAAFGGRAVIMDELAPLGAVYQAGTLSGNPLAMRAGIQTLTELERPAFYEELERKTALLTDPLEAAIQKNDWPITLNRVGSMFTLFLGQRKVRKRETLDLSLFRVFFQAMLEKGIYIPPSPYEAWFVSAAHTPDHLTFTQEAILHHLERI